MASTSTESQSFQSFAVRAESVWMEACSAADFARCGGLAYERDGNKILAPSAANLAQAKL